MKLLYDTIDEVLRLYPRMDDELVVGLDPRYLVMTLITEPEPNYNPETQRLVPMEVIDTVGRTVTRGWEIVEVPPQIIEPIPRWVEFGAALAADATANQWFGGLFPAAPILHLMIGVGLGQAAQGDAKTFLAAWGQAMAAGLIPAELLAGVVAMASGFDLPAEFIAALQSPPSLTPQPLEP